MCKACVPATTTKKKPRSQNDIAEKAEYYKFLSFVVLLLSAVQ